MLKLIIGKAGTGKTSAINQEICASVLARKGKRILIVPEQYSHEAERELCRVCGDTLSRYAEVLSFTGLARKSASAVGGLAVSYLDEGGRALCMAQAMKIVGSRLSYFRSAVSRPELQNMLLSSIERMKLSHVTTDMLIDASLNCGGLLGRKLDDLAMITDAYTAVLSTSHADPADALSSLSEAIAQGFLSKEHVIFADGFTDFTGAELSVLRAVLAKGAMLTVCLTLDDINQGNEIFSLPRSSARKLLRFAEELGIPSEVIKADGDAASYALPLRRYSEHLFSYTGEVFPHEGEIELYRAQDMLSECEAAAAKVLSLVRDKQYRWHNIAIAIRGFDEYASLLESTFEEYGIPLFTAHKNSAATRPLIVFLSCAFSILNSGWRSDDVIRYLGTGFTGLSREECDLLSDYIYLWDLKENDWKRHQPWEQSPFGYDNRIREDLSERLQQINALRDRIAAPLLALGRRTDRCCRVADQIRALTAFLQDTRLPEQLKDRSIRLRENGKAAEADEMRQLWDILITAMEQTQLILGESEMQREEFSKLFLIMLSRYSVGTIPVSLDAVTAGDFDRMRRRNIRVLLVLGADDAHLPSPDTRPDIFSEDELERLSETPAAFGEKPENEMWREALQIYNCLSLPSDRLILSYPALDRDGNETRPSLVMQTAGRLFGLPVAELSPGEAALAAARPAFRLAVSGEGAAGKAAARYFSEECGQDLASIRTAADGLRTSLSPAAAQSLYGKKLRVSASAAEKFFSCRYAYFCEFGLKARPFRRASFSAPELGNFTHYVLQHTAQEVTLRGGFQAVEDEEVADLARQAVASYEREVLNTLSEKSERFRYLFHRLSGDVVQVASDMARELRSSLFVPLQFEFNFKQLGQPLTLTTHEEQSTFSISGIADRIDGWEHDGKVYLRVFDYKTGRKEFSFTDLWYGISLQLILYLYALCLHPEATCRVLGLAEGTSLLPAGAVYAPAASRYVSAEPLDSEEKIASLHRKEKKRSGIVIYEDDLPDAWETDPAKPYSPFKVGKNGSLSGEGLLSGDQFDQLYHHITSLLAEMANAIRDGSITADPYEKSNGTSPCRNCFFREACGFRDGENGESYRPLRDMKPEAVLSALTEEEETHAF